MDAQLVERLAGIKLICLDVDGVMTDGGIYWTEDGDARRFDVKDGLGIFAARKLGYLVAVISGKSSPAVERRMQELRIEHVFQGVKDKGAIVEQLLAENRLKPEQAAHLGDDIIDIGAFEKVGFKVAVADAHPELIGRADYVTRAPGGRGAVREFMDMLIQAQGGWERMLEVFGA